MSESERDSSAERSDSRTERDTDGADAEDSSGDWANETDLDPESCPFPQCPRCGRPVTHVTSTGPTDHTASPCGCRVSPNLLE
ncbi:hypothetical protein EL22_11495 [Halostagnicola sp. A56]|uniref:hypothetical protein n=1 Tax=Halostagnicola sp. A56 TaxID=1495067 RepID=UPI00049FB022|nr:hypothetical protein [Halostagnicola sp. A56]KDE57531.1 hypothetical protein EL22_11495 [Halostagnicola sp. A56]